MTSRSKRIAPDKRKIAVLIYLTACLQVIGFTYQALRGSTYFAQYLALRTPLSGGVISIVNNIYLGLMILGLVWAFFRWSPRPFYLMGTLWLINVVFRTVLGAGQMPAFALATECVSYFWFLVIGYALRNARTLDVEIGLPSVRLLLRFGLALSFITAGLISLLSDSLSQELTAAAQSAMAYLPHQDIYVTKLLIVAGSLNVVLGFLVLVRPTRTILVYMAFWGILTALAKVAIAPLDGSFELLLRAPHFMLPFLIMVIEGQRSLRNPIRRVYHKTLRRFSFLQPPWA